jgi:class 3 adenylate cyclase
MSDSSNRTIVCSIVFLDIVEYSRKPVSEQMALKQAFNGFVGAALNGVAARDRIVLDTGDGAAITFLGDPEDALFAAMSMRDAFAAHGTLPVRMGVNLGPARLIKDINNQLNIIGDGINVAQRVMSFAEAGQLLVSRSFHEVVSCLSAEYAGLFSYIGARTDKHVREHEVFLVGAGKRAPRPAAAAPARSSHGALAALTAPAPFGLTRATYLAAPLVFFVIVGSALDLRHKRDMIAEPEPIAAPVRKPAAALAKAAPGTQRPAALHAAAKSGSDVPRDAAGSAKVQFLLLPRGGEVLVDGKSRGISPPLQEVELAAGPHTFEFRYATSPAHTERLELRPGQSIRLVHRFK